MNCRNPSTCVCCGTADSDREQAVIDAARAWEPEQEHCHDNCPCPHCELIDAVRALDGA